MYFLWNPHSGQYLGDRSYLTYDESRRRLFKTQESVAYAADAFCRTYGIKLTIERIRYR
jgi:hypothetical protein